MALFTFSKSLAPKNCEMITVDPMAIPMIKEMSVKMIGNDEPTAARASLPIYCPTMMLSTTLYNCWNILPSNMGVANWKISLLSLPTLRSFMQWIMMPGSGTVVKAKKNIAGRLINFIEPKTKEKLLLLIIL